MVFIYSCGNPVQQEEFAESMLSSSRATSGYTPITAKSGDNWVLAEDFSDEFNTSSVDWNKWFQNSNLPNTTGWLWNNSDNAELNGGSAILTMRHNANNKADNGTYFKSGILKSKKTITYGYYEAKIKGADIGEGVCPSFWLYSDFHDNVNNGETIYSEVDIVELQQFDWYNGHQDDIKDMDHNLHTVVKKNGSRFWMRPKQYPETQLNKWRAPWDPTKDYHIYGCEVNEKEIIWYVDGEEIARQPNTNWHLPMHVTLSLGLRKPFVEFHNNANHPRDIYDPNDFEKYSNYEKAQAAIGGIPTSMYVDYVRVWTKGSDNSGGDTGSGDSGNTVPSTDAPYGDIIWLKANNGNFVSVNTGAGNALQATATSVTDKELFLVEDAGDGYFALKSQINGKYVSCTTATDNPLKAGSTGVYEIQKFSWIKMDNRIAIKAKSIDRYVSSRLDETYNPLETTSTTAQAWELFSYGTDSSAIGGDSGSDTGSDTGEVSGTAPYGSTISLKASNGKYVTVNTTSANTLQAIASSITDKELFLVEDTGDGYFALKNVANGKYVTCTAETDNPLKAGASAAYNIQKFSWEKMDTRVAIKAKYNGKYVSCREDETNDPLEVTQSSAQAWELFTYITQ